jgi:Deoxyxylulose-5-phosphate synthase
VTEVKNNMYLKNIHAPADVKKLNEAELSSLASEMRSALIEKTSAKGGHLASNLGIVELTIALHYVFESPLDKIVFDVSHQTYCHKMLTGRSEAFLDPDKYENVSGYSNPYESHHDFFNIGHTSTSISLACGLAKARDLRHGKENVIAVIGDSSLDGGEAFEGLNLAGELGSGLIVVVNDNDMSIPENHGTLNKKLNELRASNGVIKDNFFKSLGFEYLFVRDGHSIPDLINALKTVRGTDHPVVVHVCTKKGKGYEYAEKNPEKWHWSRPFDVETGEFLTSVPKETMVQSFASFSGKDGKGFRGRGSGSFDSDLHRIRFGKPQKGGQTVCGCGHCRTECGNIYGRSGQGRGKTRFCHKQYFLSACL